MNEIRKQQLEALDKLGIYSVEMSRALDEMSFRTNPLDIEAQVFYVKRVAERIVEMSNKIYGDMHEINSIEASCKEVLEAWK